MKALRDWNHKLKEVLRIMSLLAEKAEKDVQQLRQAAFLQEGFQGERHVSRI